MEQNITIEQFNELVALIKKSHRLIVKELREQVEQIVASNASLEALVLTITSDETFQKIIADNLDKVAERLDLEEETKEA